MRLDQPKLSVIIPIHEMRGGENFLWATINRLTEQSFQDFEIIIKKDGKMAENTNSCIKAARGEIIKILYLDDCLAHPTALEDMIGSFREDTEWLITGCDTNPNPYYTGDIHTGNNKLGSPSCLMFRNHFENNLLFDENMSWLLDCDYYKRMYNRYGEPVIIPRVNVIIGVGEHQMTNILTDQEKKGEEDYLLTKQPTF